MHSMMATFAKIDELAIDEDEAGRLAAAIARVNELYGGMVVSEKTAAWINLMFTAGTVYGPRVVAISQRKKQEKKNKPALVMDLGQQPGGGLN